MTATSTWARITAFIHRCRLAGLTPKVDTSFRLYHIGDYAYGLEEAAGQYLDAVPQHRLPHQAVRTAEHGRGCAAEPGAMEPHAESRKQADPPAAVGAVCSAAGRSAPPAGLADRCL